MRSHKLPLVTVITVVLNGDKHLEQTIKSVTNQTYKHIEYIVIDGGSQDNSIEIIKKHENNISFWVSEKDEGIYDAMNKGISIASGELIGILNSDDWYENIAIETMVESYIKHKDKSIFHADMNFVKNTEKKILRRFNPSVFKFKYYGMTYHHPTFFVSKHVYNNERYNTKLKTISDYEFTLKIFLKNPSIFHYINTPITNFRHGGASDTINTNKLLHDGFIARKNAGLNLLENVFSLIIRSIIFYAYKTRVATSLNKWLHQK